MNMPFIAQAGKKNPRNVQGEEDKSVFASLKLSWGFQPVIRRSDGDLLLRRSIAPPSESLVAMSSPPNSRG